VPEKQADIGLIPKQRICEGSNGRVVLIGVWDMATERVRFPFKRHAFVEVLFELPGFHRRFLAYASPRGQCGHSW
jgi:hypothetical protein